MAALARRVYSRLVDSVSASGEPQPVTAAAGSRFRRRQPDAAEQARRKQWAKDMSAVGRDWKSKHEPKEV